MKAAPGGPRYDALVALRLLVSVDSDPSRVFRYDFDADRSQILLGRRGGVDVLLPHAAVSLVHARIERRGDGYVLIDDRSTNGTFVGGARLDPDRPHPLAQGDVIAIGEFRLEVAAVEGDEPAAGESSVSIARRMVAEVLGVLGPGAEHPALTVAMLAPGSPGGLQLAIAEVGRAYTVGRAPGCDLVLDEPTVAPEHLRVRRDYRGVTAQDLGSPYGLYVNDRYAAGEKGLRDGDVLTVGKVRLRFTDPAEVYLRRLEQVPTPEHAGHTTVATHLPPVGPWSSPRWRAWASKRRHGEGVVIGAAVAVAVAAVAGLLYLWLA